MRKICLVIIFSCLFFTSAKAATSEEIQWLITKIEQAEKVKQMVSWELESNGTIQVVYIVNDLRITATHNLYRKGHLHFYVRKNGTSGTDTLVTATDDNGDGKVDDGAIFDPTSPCNYKLYHSFDAFAACGLGIQDSFNKTVKMLVEVYKN